MEAQNFPPVTGRNIVAEWTGTDFPDEIVLVSGHLDSWDVGQVGTRAVAFFIGQKN